MSLSAAPRKIAAPQLVIVSERPAASRTTQIRRSLSLSGFPLLLILTVQLLCHPPFHLNWGNRHLERYCFRVFRSPDHTISGYPPPSPSTRNLRDLRNATPGMPQVFRSPDHVRSLDHPISGYPAPSPPTSIPKHLAHIIPRASQNQRPTPQITLNHCNQMS